MRARTSTNVNVIARDDALSSDGTVLASYPATIGSSTFPSPSGTMHVKAAAPNPKYYFEPEGRQWGPDQKLTVAFT